jgi:hypothetical protein
VWKSGTRKPFGQKRHLWEMCEGKRERKYKRERERERERELEIERERERERDLPSHPRRTEKSKNTT